MIDWITAFVPVIGPADGLVNLERFGGTMVYYAETGEARWEAQTWVSVVGSYAATISVRGAVGGLWVSGNPVKMLTGQNLDGPAHVPLLLAATLAVVRRIHPTLPALDGTLARCTRLDLTQSIDLGKTERVRALLRVASTAARSKYQGRGSTSHDTVYFGKHSRRHSVKLYCKADELRSHPPLGIPDCLADEIAAEAAGLLRVEATVRGMQLKEDGMQLASAWTEAGTVEREWARWWGKLTIPDGVRLMEDDQLALPPYLRTTYELWQQGCDIFELLSKATRYRHRKAIMEATAGRVDIFVLQPARALVEREAPPITEWVRDAPIWHASGRLAEWIEEKAG